MRKVLNSPECESVAVSNVTGMHGQQFKKVELIISAGKLAALENALGAYPSAVAEDLLQMFVRASGK